MLSNNGYVSKNGRKSLSSSQHTVYSSALRTRYKHLEANPKRMETTKIILTILTWVGLSSYVAGILLNLGTWKSDLLFLLGFLFMLLRFIRYSIRTWQDYRKEEIEIKIKKREIDSV